MNPWHDVAIGEDPTRAFHCVIEVPSGSKNKYELDKTTGLLRLDRVLYSAVHYPANYGFIPRTYCGDGDPLDVLVLCQEPVVPLVIMRARPIGVITMTDEEGQDDKIIAVAVDDPEFVDVNDIRELQPHRLREIQQFLRDYKSLEGKTARVGPLEGSKKAHRVIRDAIALYRDEIYPTLGVPATKRP
jgi:inorganic pyrophosphatase